MIIVYDCCDVDTFNNVKYWYGDVSRYGLSDETLFILVANKIDEATRRVVDQTEAEQYTKINDIFFHYAEISTKTGQGVTELFEMIAKEILHQVQIIVKISSQAEKVSMLLL